MWKALTATASRLLALLLIVQATPAMAQTTPEGWLGGSQSPGFPSALKTTSVILQDPASQTSPQALPGQSPTTLQPNSGTAQSTGAAPSAGWTLSEKEFQSGIAALMPGNFANTKYKWYGFARLDAIFDFNPIRSTDDFVTSSIPVPQGRGQNVALNPRYSRIGFDTSTPWTDMDWTINTKIELDFFNGNSSGNFGSYPIRLRFAYVDFGPFRFGQAASVFMDYDVFPDVLDYEGPPGMVLMRQALASVKWSPTDRLTFKLGVEQPYSDIIWDDGSGAGFVTAPGSGIITTAGAPRNIQDIPDLTGNAHYTYDYGHVQLAGIARKLTYQPSVGSADSDIGYGVNLTGTFHPWAVLDGCMPADAKDRTPLQKSRFLGQYATGRGINRYIQDVNGLGLDAVFEPVNGFDSLRAEGWFLCYEHFWTDKWISNFCYGQSWTELPEALPDTTYKGASYLAVNLIWLPVERMGVGLEFLIGERENKNGETGTAHRIQAGIQYKF
ncbi:MAG: DcaP family trimeric outer membrane transporter [Gemmatales bacterium]